MNDSNTRDSSQEIPYGYCHCGCGQKTNLIPYTQAKLGLKRGEPYRYVYGHRWAAATAEEVFRRHFVPGDDNACWEWLGAKLPSGYGMFLFGNTKYYAHRFAWELENASDAGDKQVCHRCDNPSCCNAHHLFLGTQADNSADMVQKGRAARPRGTQNPNAKLIDSDVLEIRRLAREGISQSEIASRYGMSVFAIACIVKYRTWRHVP